MTYPPQRVCRERRQLWFGFPCLFVDFGGAADVTPRFHINAELGGDAGFLVRSGDDFEALLRSTARLLHVVRCGIEQQKKRASPVSEAPSEARSSPP